MRPLFKRDDKTTIAELEEYYANQKKRRNPRAWAMGFLSIMITVGVLTGLFFGGRLAYRSVVDNEDSSDIASAPAEENKDQTTDNDLAATEKVELPTFDSDIPAEQGVSFEDSTSNNESDLIIEDTNQGVVSEEAASITVEPSDVAVNNGDQSSSGIDADTPIADLDEDQDSFDDNESESGSVAGEQTSEIPNTGASDVAFVLAITAVTGYFVSRRRQLSR